MTEDRSRPPAARYSLLRGAQEWYGDWSWAAIPLVLPPTVPASAVLHLPALRVTGGKARADVAFTRQVPAARRNGHAVAVGLDWGLNTLLAAGAVRLGADGVIVALGAGAQYRAGGVLAKQSRLRRHGEQLQAKLDQYERLAAGRPTRRSPPAPPSSTSKISATWRPAGWAAP